MALIEVKVTPQRGRGFDNIAERIYNYPEVKAVYLISGGYDLLVILGKKKPKRNCRYILCLINYQHLIVFLSTATHFYFKKYKRPRNRIK